ncbi:MULTISPECIES: LysE family translocator [Kordiimonas]|jgi:homoserine/homoserine lactone efflux protein|uniref:LysE family translocator n=1 Tax=Kordiimonas TaxID=288021 RepID=UPI002579621B|nr:LysE family translocator [Kordiimonas sp. UBA4487]
MNTALFLGFLAATLVIAVSPGPSVALASSQAVRHGPKAAFVATLGDALGTVVHILVAVMSLEVLVRSAASILPWLQIVGGLYILYLGGRSLKAAKAASEKTAKPPAYRSAFTSGFLACVSNPKAIVFFMALFPGFIDPALSLALQSAVYGTAFVLIDGAFIFGYALIAHGAATSRLGHRLNMDMLSGLGLLAVGLLLVVRGGAAI